MRVWIIPQQHSSWLQYKHATFISFWRKLSTHTHVWNGKLENCGSCVVKISGAVSHSPTAAKTIKICKSTVKDANKRINYTEEYPTAGIHLYEVYLLWNSTDIPALPTKQMRNGSCQEHSDAAAAVLWVPPYIWKLPGVYRSVRGNRGKYSCSFIAREIWRRSRLSINFVLDVSPNICLGEIKWYKLVCICWNTCMEVKIGKII